VLHRRRARVLVITRASVVAVVLGGLLITSTASAGAVRKPKPACADRIDNDGDGFVDYARKGGDPDCTSRDDGSETAVFMCTDSEGEDGLFETPPPVPNASAECDLFTGEVRLRACNVDFWDLDGIVANGCEYGPVPFTGPEVCDGVDNDADGVFDEEVIPPTVPNGSATCQDGRWVLTCDPGFADANADLADGCEVAEPA
jgi:hypothetical protein